MSETRQDTDWSEYDAREAEWAYSPRDEALQPIRYQDGLDAAFVRDWLGGATEADVHDLAGVPVGARVSVSGAGRALLAIAAVGQAKMIGRGGTELLVRYQTLVHVPLSARSGGWAAQVVKFHYCTSDPPRSGFGTDAVVRMVAACEKLGLEFIEAILAGDGQDETDESSGYYAWAASGFDSDLASWEDCRDRPLPEDLRCLANGEPVESLLDLFAVPGGPAWWKENGSTIVGRFDVKSDSDSRNRLQEARCKLAEERGGP